ncbi:MAG: hypothetical protein V8Q30_08330 [Acutalibacteraceae bacterium]
MPATPGCRKAFPVWLPTGVTRPPSSDRGRTLNAIQELNKQKTTLKDNRRALIADTLEQGKSLDEIEGQLDSYDEQLQTLEQQISDLTARLSEPETTEKEEKKSPETEEEAQKQQMGDLAELSAGWDRVGELDSRRIRPDGDRAVLESEIELDKFYAAQSGNRYRSTGKEELLSTFAAVPPSSPGRLARNSVRSPVRMTRLIRSPKPRPISQSPARNPTALSRTPLMTRKHKINRIFRQGRRSLPFCMGKLPEKAFVPCPKFTMYPFPAKLICGKIKDRI